MAFHFQTELVVMSTESSDLPLLFDKLRRTNVTILILIVHLFVTICSIQFRHLDSSLRLKIIEIVLEHGSTIQRVLDPKYQHHTHC